MARGGKGPTRLELRRQGEAVEARGESAAPDAEAKPSKARKASGATKAKKAPSKSRKAKEKAPQRKRLVWVVFSPTMKEEGRFAYDQRTAAEEKVAALKVRYNNKPYFIQPVKEVLAEVAAASKGAAAVAAEEDEPEPEPEADDEE